MIHLAVGGAGIGGLAAALAVAATGAHVTVLERRPALAEFGAGLQLSPNATRVLAHLHLLEAVRSVSLEPQSVRIRRGRDGADLVRFPLGLHAETRYGAPFLLVLRPELQRVLANQASAHPNIAIRFASDVHAAVPDGATGLRVETAAGALMTDGFIDARGVAVSRATPSGRVAWRALVPAAGLDPGHLKPDTNLWLGARTHLVHYPLPDGERVNVVAVTEDPRSTFSEAQTDLWSRPGDPEALRRAFAGWHGEALHLLDRDAHWRCWPLFDAPPLSRWSQGSVTRLGDAAHPMLPFLAQGASQSIEDAGALGQGLRAERGVAAAFAAYENQRKRRASRVQQASRRQGDIYHLARPMADARDLALQLIGGSRALARMDWLYGAP